jgi:hypothetical protein
MTARQAKQRDMDESLHFHFAGNNNRQRIEKADDISRRLCVL